MAVLLVKPPIIIFILALLKYSPEVDGQSLYMECYSYNSDEGPQYDQVSCKYSDHENDKAHCGNELSNLFPKVNEILERKITKDLSDPGRSSPGGREFTFGRYPEVVEVEEGSSRSRRSSKWATDYYACATVAVNISVLIEDGSNGKEEWKSYYVEIRGIFWGNFEAETFYDYKKREEVNPIKSNLSRTCDSKEPYGMWEKGVQMAKGEIFYCPCFDKDYCNSRNKREVPELNGNLWEKEQKGKNPKKPRVVKCKDPECCNCTVTNFASPLADESALVRVVLFVIPVLRGFW